MRYRRQLDPAGDDSLARLLKRIPPSSQVLELGPATGYMSRHLREELGCTLDAVELSAEMAESARAFCRRLVVGDVEALDLDVMLAGETYDVIVCADVLEHLRDPWGLLERLSQRLRPDGRLLLSVPNVAYLGLLVDLLRGNFRYRDEGLLDRSHLRFFTIDSLQDMLEQAGWHVWTAEPVVLGLTDSEFRVRLETLAPALRDELAERPDALCYQWVVEARRERPPERFALPRRLPEDLFQVRLFWRAAEAGFDYPRNRLVWAPLGATDHAVAFDVPPGQRALALRLSDRVGFVALRGLRLLAEGGALLWEWAEEAGSELPVGGLEGIERAAERGLWFVRDAESRLALELPAPLVAASRRVELRIDAPVSADYLAAQAYWNDPDGLPAQLARCAASCRRLALRGFADTVAGENAPELPVVVHVLPAGGGGIERFARDLCRALAGNYRHLLVRVTEQSWLVEDAATARFWLLPVRAAPQVAETLAKLQPSLVHLHSTAARPAEAAAAIAAAAGVRTGVTLHDVLFVDPHAFETEAWRANGHAPDAARAELLSSAGFLTAPSRYIAGLADQVFGVRPELVANGIDETIAPAWTDDGEVVIGGRSWRRRIVALGALGGHKGGTHLFDVAERLPEDIVVVVLGFLDGQFEPGWASEHHQSLATHPGARRIYVAGPYAPGDLPALFARFRPQLVYFPGQVPESFGYTLSETWACGGIPVVPGIGALGERASAETAVMLDAPADAAAVAACLDSWSGLDASAHRAALRARICALLPQVVPSLAAMSTRFDALYQRLDSGQSVRPDATALDELAMLCEMNLDPAQFRTELRLMTEQSQEMRAQAAERERWNDKLETDVAQLKQRNALVEAQAAELAAELRAADERHRQSIAGLETQFRSAQSAFAEQLAASEAQRETAEGQLRETRSVLAAAEAELGEARGALGDDRSAWPSYGRALRLVKRLPGFLPLLDRVAAWRRRWR